MYVSTSVFKVILEPPNVFTTFFHPSFSFCFYHHLSSLAMKKLVRIGIFAEK